MKHLLWTGLCCAAAMLTVSCSDDTGFSATDTGSVMLSLDVDRSVLSAQQLSRASLDEIAQNLSAADFTIRLTDEEGQTQEWPYESFTGEHIRIGRYTIEAFYGTEGEEGFDKPFFTGAEQITVSTDNVTSVAITAAMANAAVRVTYTDAFRAYMSEYKASVRTAGSADGIDYPASVTDDDLFVNAGEASLYVTFKTINGQQATLKAADFTAAARHRYNVTVDVNGGEIGDAVLSVTFDDETVAETREFTLSDELFNAPAPVVTPATQTIEVIEGNTPAEGGKVSIVARGGIAAVKLVTESSWLLSQGWPAEIDLLKVSAEQQQFFRQHGLNVLGLWSNPDQMAVVDFSDVIASLRSTADNLTRFRVEVEDNFGKVSDPAAMVEVNVIPMTFAITGQDICMVGDEEATLLIDYNGVDLQKNLKLECYDAGAGMWDPMTIVAVAPVSRAEASYRVTVKVPAGVDNVDVRATVGSLSSIEYTIVRGVPEFALANTPADNFATTAFVAINCDNSEDSRRIAQVAQFELSADGGNTFLGLTPAIAEGGVTLSGLQPSTSYVVRATAGPMVKTVTLRTEDALAVPNGDFETLVDALSANGMLVGGQWGISAGIYYDTKQTYDVKEPSGWATVNRKTASTDASTQNSWFVIPSTMNTTMTWQVTVPNIKFINTGGGTDTPDVFKNMTAQSGANAMHIRNVGWSHSGSRPSKWMKNGVGKEDYYCHNAASVSDRSAGKLFLGSYSIAGTTETYNEGVDFASRPTSLSGFYKYVPDANDPSETGMVTVTLLNGSQVIGTGTAQLGAAADYTRFTVPVTYTVKAKATSLRIMITSSNHASYNQADETASIKTSDYMSRYQNFALGAGLTVDNLTFNY